MKRFAVILALCALSSPVEVFAHAEEPNSQTVFGLDDGWVLRANVGIVRSAEPTELICEEAFFGGDGWILGVLGPTSWLTFGETGVRRTTDGCDFEQVVELARRPTDATTHPASGAAAFVLNGEGDASGLYVSTDEGATFSLIQSFDPERQQTTGVRFLSADTLIVSGYDREDTGAGLAWSVDVSTGEATELTLPDGLTYPYILATGGDHVLILARRGDQVLFWGTLEDIGQNELIADTWPSWATLSPDGLTAYISGTLAGRGVQVGTLDGDGNATWVARAEDSTANCVEPIGDDLFICGIGRLDGFDVASVSPDGELSTVVDFTEFEGVRSDCPADSDVATICGPVWEQLAPYFGGTVTTSPDAGMTAGTDAGGDPEPGFEPDGGTADGCCAVTAPRRVGAGWLVAFVALIGLRRRVRRH